MKAYEKIDFLMQLTHINNSQLSRVISFDASYISRIRSGKRPLPKQLPLVRLLAEFFARNIQENYQRYALREILCPDSSLPQDLFQLEALLLSWLMQQDLPKPGTMEMLTNRIANTPNYRTQASRLNQQPPAEELPSVSSHYGNEGKRTAIEYFLQTICSLEKMPPLLLSSNEEFDWLYEDKAFAKRWAKLMLKYIAKGGHIKIIHDINRNANDMLIALQKWFPLYMSGSIKSYYYPKLRDRVYKRTLFLAQNHSAVISTSIGAQTEQSLNLFIQDSQAVQALEYEFNNYLALCKPLMQLYDLHSREQFYQKLFEFESSSESLIMALSTPTFATMPRATALKMSQRCSNDWLLQRQQQGKERFERQLQLDQQVIDILNLPNPELIKTGQLAFPMCDFFDHSGLYYTAEEFKEHLQGTLEYLRRYDAYQVVLSKEIPKNEIVYVKEDLSTIVVKAGSPSIAFTTDEQHLTAAWWGYLSRIAEYANDKEETIIELEKYLQHLN